MKVTIWHNPRCSKSRQTLRLLEDHGIEPEVRLYLESPPSAQEVRTLLAQLGLSARELMRRSEAEYKRLGLREVDDDTELIAAMVEHPKLIERPVVVRGDAARLGRPPQNVLGLLE